MLDITLIREHPEIVKASEKKRNRDPKAVDEILKLDQEWRSELKNAEQLKHKRNVVSEEINQAKKSGNNAQAEKKIKEMRSVAENIKQSEEKVNGLLSQRNHLLKQLANISNPSMPMGKDENDNVVLREVGKKPKFNFKLKSHVDIIKDLDLVDLERAAKVAGARFYYLKNELVLLNQALLRFALDLALKKGLTLIQPPYMLRKEVYERVTSLDQFEETLYRIEGDDALYLIATAEHPLVEMHADEIIDAKSLPLKYAGISSCFRKELGAHGKDTKGIFRVHQFDKIEQLVFCKPEESYQWQEKLLKNAEEIFRALKIPYRVVNVCSGDASIKNALQYDIEAWMPVQETYREVVSCDNCTSWESVRSNIKFKDGEQKEYVHTVDCTLIANPRAIVAILENFQTKDETIKIPKVLWKYMGGIKEIGKR